MDPRFAAYAVASHWPYLDHHLELSRQRAVRRALWLLAQLQVDVDGAPVLLGRSRLRDLGLTPGEADRVAAILRELDDRRVVARYAGGGRRPDAWAFRAPLDHWRGFTWRTQGGKATAEVAFKCARSRFCEARCDFVSYLPDQGLDPKRAIVLATASHLFPSGETLARFGYKIAAQHTKSRPLVDFVPSPPVDLPHYGPRELAPTPSSSFSTDVENSVSLDRQQRIEVLQGAFRAAGGGEIFRSSKRWGDLVDLVNALTDDQLDAVAREVAEANVRREHKLLAPLLLDRARALAGAPAIVRLADVATG